MIYVHKILPVFLSPIAIILLLLAMGMLTRRRVFVVIGIAILYFLSIPLVSNTISRAIEGNVEQIRPEDAPAADAVVVLSRGMSWTKTKDGFSPDWSDPDRFFGGVELFLHQKAQLLVFTGGKLPWQLGTDTEGDVLRHYALLMNVPDINIRVTGSVENTAQESQAVRKLLGPEVKKIILVTSAFHMQRAQKLFEGQGFDVFPYAVDVHNPTTLTLMSFLPSAWAFASVDNSWRELLGRLYYTLKSG